MFQNSIKWIRRWQGHFFQIVTFDFYIIDKVGPLQQLFHVYGANVDHLSHHTVVVSRVVVITPPATTNGQRRPKVGGIGRVCWWGLFLGSEWKEMRGHIPPRSNGHYQLISMKTNKLIGKVPDLIIEALVNCRVCEGWCFFSADDLHLVRHPMTPLGIFKWRSKSIFFLLKQYHLKLAKEYRIYLSRGTVVHKLKSVVEIHLLLFFKCYLDLNECQKWEIKGECYVPFVFLIWYFEC